MWSIMNNDISHNTGHIGVLRVRGGGGKGLGHCLEIASRKGLEFDYYTLEGIDFKDLDDVHFCFLSTYCSGCDTESKPLYLSYKIELKQNIIVFYMLYMLYYIVIL